MEKRKSVTKKTVNKHRHRSEVETQIYANKCVQKSMREILIHSIVTETDIFEDKMSSNNSFGLTQYSNSNNQGISKHQNSHVSLRISQDSSPRNESHQKVTNKNSPRSICNKISASTRLISSTEIARKRKVLRPAQKFSGANNSIHNSIDENRSKSSGSDITGVGERFVCDSKDRREACVKSSKTPLAGKDSLPRSVKVMSPVSLKNATVELFMVNKSLTPASHVSCNPLKEYDSTQYFRLSVRQLIYYFENLKNLTELNRKGSVPRKKDLNNLFSSNSSEVLSKSIVSKCVKPVKIGTMEDENVNKSHKEFLEEKLGYGSNLSNERLPTDFKENKNSNHTKDVDLTQEISISNYDFEEKFSEEKMGSGSNLSTKWSSTDFKENENYNITKEVDVSQEMSISNTIFDGNLDLNKTRKLSYFQQKKIDSENDKSVLINNGKKFSSSCNVLQNRFCQSNVKNNCSGKQLEFIECDTTKENCLIKEDRKEEIDMSVQKPKHLTKLMHDKSKSCRKDSFLIDTFNCSKNRKISEGSLINGEEVQFNTLESNPDNSSSKCSNAQSCSVKCREKYKPHLYKIEVYKSRKWKKKLLFLLLFLMTMFWISNSY